MMGHKRKDAGIRRAIGLLQQIALLMLLLLGAGVSRLHAQAVAGITGTVTDATGAVVPQASVDITSQDTSETQHVVTSGAGTYALTGLLPGRYRVTVDAKGYKKQVQNDVLMEIGKQSTIDVKLSAGAATETVQVNSNSIALDTTQPQLGTTLEPALIKSLPIEVAGRGRQIDQFQFLAPGVQGSSFTHEVSGGVWFQQEVVVNGIPILQSETEGMTTIVNPPFELIREFRVERSTFAAQYGLAQGAINYQTASGANKYHGAIFEINRNSSFDSKGFFNTEVPTDHENNYGFTVSGPVRLPKLYNGKDRTFFNFTYEWYKQNLQSSALATVPTAREKMGDFGDFVDGTTGALIPIYDPQTHQPFFQNKIPTNRFSALSKTLLPFLPDPNRPGTNVGGLNSNASPAPFANQTIQHNWGFTIDHNLTEKQSLHYAEWRDSYSTTQFLYAPFVVQPNPLSTGLTEPQTGTGFLLSYSNTVTPHLVVTAGAGWLGEINNEFPNAPYTFPGVEDGGHLPLISFNGQHAPTSWGSVIRVSANRKLGISIVNNWLWNKGRHTFNMGGEVRRTYQDATQDGGGGGSLSFSTATTSAPFLLPDGTPNPLFQTEGSAFASFLLGQVDSASRNFSQEIRLRNFDLSPYIQDDIKITPRLTVNVGLRWDIMVPFTANENNVVFLNPDAPNSYAGNLPGVATQLGHCSLCAGYDRADIHWGHFGPRFGFAYLLTPKTVVQAGFNLTFLNGGAYAYGDTLVADNYTQLLSGAYNSPSLGTNTPSYGSWDAKTLPVPPAATLTPKLGVGNPIYQFNRNDGYAPYTQQWNFNIQRQLPYDTFLTVAYVGNREIHIISNLNAPQQPNPSILQLGPQLNLSFADGTAQAAGFHTPYPNFVNDFGGNATVGRSLLPFPQYSTVQNYFEGSGTVFYNGLQVQGEKRYTNGLAFLTSLTVARTMSNTDSGNGAFVSTALNKYNQRQEWSVASSDQKYNFKISGTYELPLGRGKRWLNGNKVVSAVVGGIQFGGILDYEGGSPLGVSSASTTWLVGQTGLTASLPFR